MVGGMPILGKHRMGEAFEEAIDGGDHFIAPRNGERAAGAKVVLDVDGDEDVVAGIDREHGGMLVKGEGTVAVNSV